MSISKKEKKKIINWNNTEENLWCDKRYRKKERKKKEREVSKKSLPRWIVGIIWTFAWMKAVTHSLPLLLLPTFISSNPFFPCEFVGVWSD